MATAWPVVKAWLAATAPALAPFANAEVTSGPVSTMSAATKYMTVGAVDDEDNAGTYQRATAYDGTVWSEIGEVRSTIVAQSGFADGSQPEADAFAMVEALDAAIHTDPTLGNRLSPEAEIQTSVDVLSVSNGDGTATALVYVVRYTTTV